MPREPHVHDLPRLAGRVLVVTDARVGVYWPGWAQWRFGQRCPEMIGFRDMEERVHKEVAGQ